MIAIILAAGKGSRLSNYNSCSSKCMLPVHGKPLLHRTIYHLTKCNDLKKIYIVIRQDEESIPNYFKNKYLNIPIEYVYQSEDKPGIINAVYSFKEINNYEGEDIIINLGDEYYENIDFNDLIYNHKKNNSAVTSVVIYSEDENEVKNNYTVNILENNEIIEAIEKPTKIFNKYVGTGILIVKGNILKNFSLWCKNRFEDKELVDWIKFSILNNEHCYAYKSETRFCNLNYKKDLEYLYKLSNKHNDKELLDTFLKISKEKPNNKALINKDRYITYKQLDYKSNILANNLMKNRFESGQSVSVSIKDPIESLIAFIGILKAGGVYLYLEKNLSNTNIKSIIKDYNIKFLITDKKEEYKFDSVKLMNIDNILSYYGNEKYESNIFYEEKAMIVCSENLINNEMDYSIIKRNSIMNIISSIEDLIDNNKNENLQIGLVSSFSDFKSIKLLYFSLLNGGTINILDNKENSDIEYLIEEINNLDICELTLKIISKINEYIIRNPKIEIKIKYLIISGQVDNMGILKKLYARSKIINTYEIFENSGVSSLAYVNLIDLNKNKGILIGKPVNNVNIYLLDPNKKIVGHNKIGEIWISGENLSLDSKRNSDRYSKDIINDKAYMLKTGDYGYLGLDGNIYCYRNNLIENNLEYVE